MNSVLVILVVYLVSVGKCATTGCEINPFGSKTPLVVKYGTTFLIEPTPGYTTLSFTRNALVEFACPGTQITKNGTSLGAIVTATCKTGDVFTINGHDVHWSYLSCHNVINPTVREITRDTDTNDPNNQCVSDDKKLKIIQIGFALSTDRFTEAMTICFDSTSKLAIYTYFILSASINYRARNVANPSFSQDDIFYRMGRSVNAMYQNIQTTYNTLVGLESTSTQYVNTSIFPNRGHLAAKADFVYEPHQRATYRYVNAAPQWNTFNGGNWNQVETDVRNYANNKNVNLKVWTGVYGISSLPHSQTQELVDLYIYVNHQDKSHSPALPAPEVFWRLVYEPITQHCIVLVGHNNPYEAITSSNQKICNTDVAAKVTWLKWNKNNVRTGYSYACNCADTKFRSLITVLPNLTIKGLLE